MIANVRRLGVVALVFVLLTACSGDGILVTQARIGQPTGPNAALYLTASSDGGADRLVAADTTVAAAVELHETTMGDDGTMSMGSVDAFQLPAEEELVLEPGGYHLMLIDADRLDVGDVVEVTLTWEDAGEMIVEAEVVGPAEVTGGP